MPDYMPEEVSTAVASLQAMHDDVPNLHSSTPRVQFVRYAIERAICAMHGQHIDDSAEVLAIIGAQWHRYWVEWRALYKALRGGGGAPAGAFARCELVGQIMDACCKAQDVLLRMY